METLFFFIPEQLGKALGWMVLHALWQATFISIAAGILLILLRNRPARLRYWTANAALLLILGTAAATFLYYYEAKPLEQAEAFAPPLGALRTPLSPESAPMHPEMQEADGGSRIAMEDYFNRHLPLIVAFWFLGMSVFALRLIGHIGYVYYLKKHLNFPAEQFWEDLLQQLSGRFRVKKPIALLESALVRTPLLVGYLKPVILFPIGMINRMDPANVEAILAHELAHIAHHDYLFNIFQSIAETIFYFHPAIWWLSARIRHEREIAADDAAVRVTGNSMEYAKTLVLVQEFAFHAPAASLAFAGLRRNQLMRRIQHILHIKQSTNLAMEKIIGTCAILLLLFGFGYAQNKNTVQLHQDIELNNSAGNALSGLWEGKIENERVCITWSSRSEHSSWVNGNCFPKADFSALPTQESEFTLRRPAGTITLKGKFENNEGYGRFRFEADPAFNAWLSEQGITGMNEEELVHLFFANVGKDYVLALKKAGYNEVSGENLLNLAMHQVGQQDVEAYGALSNALGEGKPSIETILSLKIHEIDATYVKSLTQAGFSKLSIEDIVSARIHGITPEYVQQVGAMGYNKLTFEEVLNFKIHDMTPDFLNELKKAGLGSLDADEALNMRIHEVSTAEIGEFKKMGFKDLAPEELVGLKIHGITPAFLNDMREAGFGDLSAEEAMSLKIHDITPEFIQKMNQGGFDNLSVEDALSLKIHDVAPEDLAPYAQLGFKKIDIEQAVSLKIHGVTPEFIASMRSKGFTDLSLEEYINLKVQYGNKMK